MQRLFDQSKDMLANYCYEHASGGATELRNHNVDFLQHFETNIILLPHHPTCPQIFKTQYTQTQGPKPNQAAITTLLQGATQTKLVERKQIESAKIE